MEKIQLTMDTENCIRCGRCVKVCPSQVFRQENKKTAVVIVRPDSCISCGQCVAICPKGVLTHSAFPSEKIHPFDRKEYPAPAQLALLLKARRSVRAFSQKPVSPELLAQIIEAGYCAPTAHNKQEVRFTLVTDPDKLCQIANYTLEIFRSVTRKLNNPLLKPILKRVMPDVYQYLSAISQLIKDADEGNEVVLRYATAVLLIHTPTSTFFGTTDTNLAYQNASLMAECLGVGHFYIGLVCAAIQQDKKNKLAKLLDIDGKISAGMALGIPEFHFSK